MGWMRTWIVIVLLFLLWIHQWVKSPVLDGIFFGLCLVGLAIWAYYSFRKNK